MKPSKPCKKPGCRKLIKDGRFCEEHQKQFKKEYDQGRGTSGERGYDATWRKVRDMKLKTDPLCEDCMGRGKVKEAVLVHHIKPVKDYPELRLVFSNLRSLCDDCHEEIHAKDRWKVR